MSLYDLALEFATQKHKGQVRQSGEPVINHPVGVANILKGSGYGEDYQVVGLFHDLIEDTDTTKEELLEFLIPLTPLAYDIVDGVVSLTKTDDMTLEESLQNAKVNKYGKVIKGADRLQNALTTYLDKNSQEFISGFLYKTFVYYLPILVEVENIYIQPLIQEMRRLYNGLIPKAKEWEDSKLAENNINANDVLYGV